jgi:hypothetical protein
MAYGDNDPDDPGAVHFARTRIVTQIAAIPATVGPHHLGLGWTGAMSEDARPLFYALCNDGTVWVLVKHHHDQHQWNRLPAIPQD